MGKHLLSYSRAYVDDSYIVGTTTLEYIYCWRGLVALKRVGTTLGW